MSENKKKFIVEQLLTNEVSKFELSFYEKMLGEEFLNDDLFKILRVFSEVQAFDLLPFFLNQEHLFWIDHQDTVLIHKMNGSKRNLLNERYIFLCKIRNEALNSREKKEKEDFIRKINKLTIKHIDLPENASVIFPIKILYAQQVEIGR